VNDSPLDRPARVATIRELAASGLISEEAAEAAAGLVRPAGAWWSWISRMLLFIGAALCLSGVIFFFAYNWSRMSRFDKLGLIEAGMAISVAGAVYLGRDRLSGKVLLMAASVLVGALLAVYGQAYQTGADAYELFVGWALLILGFVAYANFAGLWILWLVILQTGIVLYWFQVGDPNHQIGHGALLIFLAGVNSAALLAREAGAWLGLSWLESRWTRRLLITAVMAALLFPSFETIIELGDVGPWSLLGLPLAIAAIVFGQWIYRNVLPDLAAMALLVMAACALIIVFAGRIIFETMPDEISALASMSITVLMVTGAGVFWLRWNARTMGRPDDE